MRMNRAAVVLALALCWPAHNALAGMFDDNEARKRIEQLRTDVDGLSARIERVNKNQLDFANQIEAINADLARIRGQLEVLTNNIETTQKRQRDFYVDLDTRLRKLESGTPTASGTGSTDSPKADPAQEGRDYEAALGQFKAARYKEAGGAFQAFIKSYPASTLLPNAHYWLASCHYQLRDFDKAADYFAKVAATWPSDPKAADALLAQGNALTEAGDTRNARKVLEVLIDQYPASSAAQTAKQRLKKK